MRGVDDPWLDLEARDEGVAEKGQIAAVLSRTWTVYAGHERTRAHRAVRRGVGSVALCPLDMNRRSRRVRSKEARRHTAASRGARPAERRLFQGTFVALPYTAVEKQQRPPPARLASGGGATDRGRAVCVRAGKDVRVGSVSREHEAMRRPRARAHHDAASHSAPLSAGTGRACRRGK